MRYRTRRRTHTSRRSRAGNRTLRVLRQLCAERARLAEEVKQLSAAVAIYRDLAERTGAAAPMECQAA